MLNFILFGAFILGLLGKIKHIKWALKLIGSLAALDILLEIIFHGFFYITVSVIISTLLIIVIIIYQRARAILEWVLWTPIHFISLSGFYVAVHTCLSHWGNIGNKRRQFFTAFYASVFLFRIRVVCYVMVFLYNIHGIYKVIPKFIFGRCWLLKFFLK